MKIVIGHLFYDLLNLYGESGNIIALKQALETQGIEVELKNISIDNDKWNLQELDFVYIGTGTENNQKIALEYLKEHKEEIIEAIENNKFFLATGNAIELFGKYIVDENEKLETLGIFDYYTKRTKNRVVSECVFKFKEIEAKILGFENHQGKTIESNSPMFTVEKGFGSEENSASEGYMENNFYATYLIGPLLVRNPELLEKICRDLILSIDNEFEFKEFDFEIEKKAHDRFLEKYKN